MRYLEQLKKGENVSLDELSKLSEPLLTVMTVPQGKHSGEKEAPADWYGEETGKAIDELNRIFKFVPKVPQATRDEARALEGTLDAAERRDDREEFLEALTRWKETWITAYQQADRKGEEQCVMKW